MATAPALRRAEIRRSQRSGNGSPAEYGAFLEGKRVIVVGPAGYLQGRGLGEWIDSFDVVVRLNWGIPVPSELARDLGSRCDVLYKRLLKLGKIDFIDAREYADAGLTWLVAIDNRLNTTHTAHLTEMLGDSLRWFVEHETRRRVALEISTSPLIGLIAVKHLLAHGVQSVTVTGCDFYQTGYHDGYGGREYREYMRRKEGTIGPTHDGAKQLRYLSRLRSEDKRLEFDEELEMLSNHAPPDPKLIAGVVAVIPARYGSSRFPGKPLALIHGRPMILHVCKRVARTGIKVVVATDDERIAKVVRAAGYRAVMTKEAMTGTDRVAQVAAQVPATIYVNVQGDEPLIDPAAVVAVVEAKHRNPREVVNAVTALGEGEAESRDVVKAVIRRPGWRLIYCSRAPVPAGREGHAAAWKQLGLYAFNRRELAQFAKFTKRGELEAAEDVEILRFIEAGIPVRMVPVAGSAQAVDQPEHIAIVERLMR